jgi:hypothetical protein
MMKLKQIVKQTKRNYKMNEKELRQLINEVTAEIIADADAVKVATTERGGYTVDGQWLDVSGEDMTPSEALVSLASTGVTHVVDGDADGARYTLNDWKNKVGKSPINPGDGEFTEEEGLLLQQLSDDAVEEESLENDDSVPFDHQGEGYESDRLDQDEAELEDNPQATHFSDDPGNDEFMKWSTVAAGLMKNSKITQAEDIPWFTDAYGNAELSPYDEYKRGTSPEEYANLVDEYEAGGVWSDDKDYEAGFMRESKEFTFDKFMKDINEREDKIEQHKIELTENDGDTNARLKQRLYQEDWRNSVKFKGNK